MNKGLLILCVLVFSTAIDAGASVTKVCATCPVSSLKAAIEQARPHDTIHLAAETFYEHSLIVEIPLTITGDKGAVIDGRNEGNILHVSADSVTIENLIIRHVGQSYTQDHSAIRLSRCKHFRIAHNILEDIFFGIVIERSTDGVIIQNAISSDAQDEISSGNGIHLFYCKRLLVEGNHITRVRDGIYLEFVDDSRITKNLSEYNLRYGLHFMFSNRDSYDRNVFQHNGAGVAVMFSKEITMEENRFLENWGNSSYGLLLKEINDAVIRKNHFEKNTTAINIEGSNRILYEHNTFLSNGWAMKFRGGCYVNEVKSNDFLYNTFDISYKGKMNDNLFEQNYWSSYTGYDLNRDGTGDVPYRPVKLFSYIVNENPTSIILLRSLFVDLINFSEKVSPVFTPDNLMDMLPRMKPTL